MCFPTESHSKQDNKCARSLHRGTGVLHCVFPNKRSGWFVQAFKIIRVKKDVWFKQKFSMVYIHSFSCCTLPLDLDSCRLHRVQLCHVLVVIIELYPSSQKEKNNPKKIFQDPFVLCSTILPSGFLSMSCYDQYYDKSAA